MVLPTAPALERAAVTERLAHPNRPLGSYADMVGLGQASYYVLTGIWPFVSMKTFEAVTGPKAENWLVKAVGLLVAIVGGVLGYAGWRGITTPLIAGLGIGSAIGLTAIDIVYVARGRLGFAYVLDAIGEVALVGAWLASILFRPSSRTRTRFS